MSVLRLTPTLDVHAQRHGGVGHAGAVRHDHPQRIVQEGCGGPTSGFETGQRLRRSHPAVLITGSPMRSKATGRNSSRALASTPPPPPPPPVGYDGPSFASKIKRHLRSPRLVPPLPLRAARHHGRHALAQMSWRKPCFAAKPSTIVPQLIRMAVG